MSSFLGGTGANFVIARDDKRAVDAAFLSCDYGVLATPVEIGYATCWWPARTMGVGDADGFGGIVSRSGLAYVYPVAGSNGRLALTGFTRDQYGSPLGNCTVKCFRTLDDSLQSKVTSDVDGLYSVTTPYADGHYLIVYKAGPPDICGTTINTLAPG